VAFDLVVEKLLGRDPCHAVNRTHRSDTRNTIHSPIIHIAASLLKPKGSCTTSKVRDEITLAFAARLVRPGPAMLRDRMVRNSLRSGRRLSCYVRPAPNRSILDSL